MTQVLFLHPPSTFSPSLPSESFPSTLPVPMSYFPSILSDPQLAISKQEKNLILGAASSEWMRNKRNLIFYAIAVIAWATCIVLVRVFLSNITPSSTLFAVLLWIFYFIIFFVGSHYLVFHIRFRPYLYQELRNRGYDICEKCGYILIDIPESSERCPECGTTRSALPTEIIAE